MISITRDNVEELLDQGKLYAMMGNGRWWRLRRNGKTRRWKRDPNQFEIPTKTGFKTYLQITSGHFYIGGLLFSDHFRHVDDVPKELRLLIECAMQLPVVGGKGL